METNPQSRESILAEIRKNLPQQRVSRPQIPAFPNPDRPLRLIFEEHLAKAGAVAHPVASPAEAAAKLATLHPSAKVVCSAVPEIAGTRRVADVHNPHELADVNIGVMRAQFGVAESGAVWVTQEEPDRHCPGIPSRSTLSSSWIPMTSWHRCMRRIVEFGSIKLRTAASWRGHQRRRILRPR